MDNKTDINFQGIPCTEFSRKVLESGISLVDALVACGLCKSKSEARRLIKGGGVYIGRVAKCTLRGCKWVDTTQVVDAGSIPATSTTF